MYTKASFDLCLYTGFRKISYTKEALELNAKLLEINPEFMTAWNYRKLAFEHNISSQSEVEKADSDHIKSIIDEELRVVSSYLALI